MAIVAYTGLPGHGKSYSVVEHVILPAIRNKRLVYTNIPLHLDIIYQDYKDAQIVESTTEELKSEEYLQSIPGGAICVFDEVGKIWPSGLRQSNVPQGTQEFFTEHRHKSGEDGYTQEIVLVTQDLNMICSFIRSLVERTFTSVKYVNLGMSKRYRVDIYEGGKTSTNRQLKLDTKQGLKYKPSIYKYYVSHTKSENGSAGMEVQADKRGSIWRNPRIAFMPIAALMVIFGVYFTFKTIAGMGGAEASDSPVSTPQVQEQISVQQEAVKPLPQVVQSKVHIPPAKEVGQPPNLNYSTEWRIVGHMKSKTKDMVMLTNGDGMSRVITMDRCEFTRWDELHCVVDGEVATPWTTSKRFIAVSQHQAQAASGK